MATRLTQAQRRERTRRRLLVSARKAFARHGYSGAALDDIAAAAGLTRGALYYNFPAGKRDLFLALLSERTEGRASAIRQALEGDGGDLDRRVREAALGTAAATPREHRAEWLVFFEFALQASRDRTFARAFARSEGRMRHALADVIAERAEALGQDQLPLSPQELATGITALANGLGLEGLIDEEAVPPHLFATLIGLLVRGILATAEDERPAGPARRDRKQ